MKWIDCYNKIETLKQNTKKKKKKKRINYSLLIQTVNCLKVNGLITHIPYSKKKTCSQINHSPLKKYIIKLSHKNNESKSFESYRS